MCETKVSIGIREALVDIATGHEGRHKWANATASFPWEHCSDFCFVLFGSWTEVDGPSPIQIDMTYTIISFYVASK